MNRNLPKFAQIAALIFSAIGVTYFGQSYQVQKYQIDTPLTYEQVALVRHSTNPKANVNLSAMVKSNSPKNTYVSDAKLNLHIPDKTWKAFVLYPISGTLDTTLVNNEGVVVHKWRGIDVDRARLLPNGNLLVLHGSKYLMNEEPWKSMRKQVSEYDWQGNLVWSYRSQHVLHHDVQRLPNGNTLVLEKNSVPEKYLKQIQDPLRKTLAIKADSILEIAPSGKLVWRWNSWEHFDINDCGFRDCLGEKAAELDPNFDINDRKDWTHINTIAVLPENQWFRQGDQRFKPGNILIMPRNFWTMYIIDKDSGKLVWEYRGNHRGGIMGGHEPSMIKEGLPGAGNILVVDNGNAQRNNTSLILEINPQTKELAWVYDVGPEFFTHARGSVQRLPNGNTLISEDRSGRLFEVTKSSEKVWEYGATLISVRPQKYAPDYCPQFASLPL